MATNAYLGSQSLLQIGNGASPEVFTTIGEVVSIDPIAQAKDLVEVTHLESTAKEFIGGLADGAEVNFTCNFLPNSQQHLDLIAAAAAITAAKNFKYKTGASAPGGVRTCSFSALVLRSGVGTTTPNAQVPLVIGLKITGAISPFVS